MNLLQQDDSFAPAVSDSHRDYLVRPFSDYVTEQIDRLHRAHWQVNLTVTDDLKRLPAQDTMILQQVLREAVNNVLRHGDQSQPCGIIIDITNGLQLLVINSTAENEPEMVEGTGLRGIRARIESAGGDCEFLHLPGQWLLTVRLPISVEELA